MTGYELPPAFLIVTADIRGYVSLSERRQPYIDGGLFSMAIILGLEYVGLAACSLNAMFSTKAEKKIRFVSGIGNEEAIIMCIAVGNFKSENNVAKSFRYPLENITKNH